MGAIVAAWFSAGWADAAVVTAVALLLAVSYGARLRARRRLLYRSSRLPVSRYRRGVRD